MLRSGVSRLIVPGTQRDHHTSRSNWNLDRSPQLVPARLFPRLSDVIPADVLQDGAEQRLVVIPDRTNCLRLLAEGAQTNLEYRWLLRV